MVMQEKSMSSTPMVSTDDRALWGVEENLPSLACQAAVELDNLILSEGEGLDAVRQLNAVGQLIEVISNSGLTSNSTDQTNQLPLAHLNPVTAVALNGAIGDSQPTISMTTVYDLMKQADQITQRLKQVVENLQKAKEEDVEEIKKLRSFCLALSKRALANEPPLNDLKPQHPYRR